MNEVYRIFDDQLDFPQVDLRNDGRKRNDYRPMELETDIVTHASGSARLRLANTDILVGVKAEIDAPYPESPKTGKIEFFVDWYVVTGKL